MVFGLTEKLKAKPILGISDVETVMLDFDDTDFEKVKYWALRTMKWFRLGGFLVLKSSEKHYHVVFNREVSWSENMRIVAWVALQSRNQGLLKWFLMQCIKESSTLRISTKRQKPSPRIVFRYSKEDHQIKHFLKDRDLIRNFARNW
jgi:hypothetical protein